MPCEIGKYFDCLCVFEGIDLTLKSRPNFSILITQLEPNLLFKDNFYLTYQKKHLQVFFMYTLKYVCFNNIFMIYVHTSYPILYKNN